jgi:hypothetical protein
MIATLGTRRVSKNKGGRPANSEGDQATRGVRCLSDTADMMSWVCRVMNVKQAVFLDSLIRNAVVAKYRELYPKVRMLHDLDKQETELIGDSPAPDLPTVMVPSESGGLIPIEEEFTRSSHQKKPKK